MKGRCAVRYYLIWGFVKLSVVKCSILVKCCVVRCCIAVKHCLVKCSSAVILVKGSSAVMCCVVRRCSAVKCWEVYLSYIMVRILTVKGNVVKFSSAVT